MLLSSSIDGTISEWDLFDLKQKVNITESKLLASCIVLDRFCLLITQFYLSI